MLYVFASFSVTNSVLNVGFHDYKDDRNAFLASSLGVSTCFTLLLLVLYLCFRNTFIAIIGLDESYVVLMFLSFVFITTTQLWINQQRYEYKYKQVFWVTSITAIISTVISLWAVYFTDNNHAGVKLWSSNILPICVGIYFFVYIVRKGKCLFKREYWKFILLFNAPLLLHYLSQFVMDSSDRIMINHYCNENYVAIYSLAYSLSNIILIFFYPVNSAIIPHVHKLVDSKDLKSVEKLYVRILVPIGLLLWLISLFSPELIAVLGGEKYHEGAYLVPVVLSSTIFVMFYQLISNIEFLYGKTHRVAIMTITAALLNISLNIIFIPVFGYQAAAYTTLATYMVYSLLHWYNMSKLCGNKILKIHTTLVVFSITLLLCMSSTLLFDNITMRFVLAIVALMIALRIYKKIKL